MHYFERDSIESERKTIYFQCDGLTGIYEWEIDRLAI
jgi:hypothetical protein